MPKENANVKLEKWLNFKVVKTKDFAFEIRDDKSLWERMTLPDSTEVLLVEESYYDGIAEDVEKLQDKIKSLQHQLDAKIMFVSNGMEEEHYALQEKVIRYEKALEEIATETGTPYAEIARETLEG